jgi:amino acid transporter
MASAPPWRGIYVLLGSVVGSTGVYTPIAFLLASLMAAFTAFSFAELAARHEGAGEAMYTIAASASWLAVTVGL